ncbi:MAG: hypothetical protein HGA67_04485 [Candidatus Yonathbacteria bacterium]|nr:hypothetical protein [Candidatus Yonathbacteria bacterium]
MMKRSSKNNTSFREGVFRQSERHVARYLQTAKTGAVSFSRGMTAPKQGFLLGALFLGVASFAYLGAPFLSLRYNAGESSDGAGVFSAFGTDKTKEAQMPKVISAAHVPIPKPVKALYMTACAAATPSLREHIVGLATSSAINAVIIDIKDYSGTVSFHTGVPELEDSTENAPGCVVKDMKEFVADLHAKDIYVIGRVTVFQDPYYAPKHPSLAVQRASDRGVWKDRKGISFVDVSARPYWDHVVLLAKTSYLAGFDEINFDYVRFPSDGNMKDIYFPASNTLLANDPENGKAEALKAFFVYLSAALRDTAWLPEGDTGPVLSADLFGMTTTNTDDLNIGQVLEYVAPYVDFIAPMVYPSHYPKGFNGYSDPNAHCYDIIKFSMDKAVARMKAIGEDPLKLRPWLQDFDYPVPYTPGMVSAQIKATYDAGLTSFMLWDPANKYTPSILND